ncbi:MAG: S49 family peptidase [Alphaproteobacteria bacterium]|nr:S49 family peptidase [Alphaproteobacteria bacterium]
MAWLGDMFGRTPVVPVVRLHGVIGGIGRLPGARGLTLAQVAPWLERAFGLRGAKAVALSINSPGGAPVQSALIAGRVRALAAEKKLPVIAFIEDVAASGGYWLASAADEIYADPASVVGSIGVISAGFGFAGALERLGIERRLHVQGERKSLLDPFRPERPEDVARLERLQRDIHEQFKAQIRQRRGARLKGEEAALFSGEIWTGREALALGLVDGLGDLRGEMRRRFGDKVKLRPIGGESGWLRRRFGLGGEVAAEALALIEERAAYARFGL